MKTFTLAVAAVAAFGALAVAPAAQATTSQATSSHPAARQASTSATASDAVSLVHPAAYEDDVATPGTHPSFASGECVSMSGHQVCFKRHGDVIWVEGDHSNVMSADWENYLRDRNGKWTFYRSGSCMNTHSGWGYCNKNFYEDSSTNYYGGTGSGLRLQSCPGGPCSPQIWIRNNA